MRMVSPVLSVRIRSAAFLEDSKGRIWLSTDRGGICCFQDEAFEVYSLEEGLPDDIVFKAVEDTRGNICWNEPRACVSESGEQRSTGVWIKKTV